MYNDLQSNPFQKEQSLHTVSKTGSKFCEGLQFVDVEGLVALSLDASSWVWPTPEHINSPEVVAEWIEADPLLKDSFVMGNSLIQ